MPRGPAQVYEIDIDAPAERVWLWLVKPDLTQRYYFGTRVESDWKVGSSVRYRNASNAVDVDGELLEFSPPRRLATTFQPRFADLPPSRVIWEVAPTEHGSHITLTHEEFDTSSPGAEMITQAWQPTLDALKQAVEQNETPNAAESGRASPDINKEGDTTQA